MKVIAIVPVKYHSSRVPGKNYRLMNGKPLYWYVFNTLTNADNIDEIILNTDNKDLGLRISNDFPNVKIHHRPDNLKGDDVSTNLLIIDTVETLKLTDDINIFLQTHVTNPLITSKTIDAAINMYTYSIHNDTLFSVKRLQTRLYDHNHKAINHNQNNLIPTQE